MQPGPGNAQATESLPPEVLDARIARVMAKASSRPAPDNTDSQGLRAGQQGRVSKVPSLVVQSPELAEEDYGRYFHRTTSIKAYPPAARLGSVHPLTTEEARASPRPGRATEYPPLVTPSATSPARSVSAVENPRALSPPGQRELAPGRPRAQSHPASSSSLEPPPLEEAYANGARRLAPPAPTPSELDAASRRKLRRPSSFEKFSDRGGGPVEALAADARMLARPSSFSVDRTELAEQRARIATPRSPRAAALWYVQRWDPHGYGILTVHWKFPSLIAVRQVLGTVIPPYFLTINDMGYEVSCRVLAKANLQYARSR